MNISIGGRPIGKVIAGYITAVVVDGIAIVIDAVSKDWSMSREAWISLLIGSFGPPTAAYLRKMSGKDIQQIVDAAPERVAAEANLVLKNKAPY
jgi:hypothetical protein